MTPRGISPKRRMRDRLRPLVGARITNADMVEIKGLYGDVPVLLVTLRTGKRAALLIMQDPEGNGPGFIEIEDIPDK